jgi:tetratricopeptide (TPR) repeat protein
MASFLARSLEFGAQSATAETSSPVILPANTPVLLHLTKSLYKKDAKPGHPMEFEVGYDVVVNGQIFIQSGTVVNGSFKRVDHAGKGPAKVLIDAGPAKTVSGETVRLAWAGMIAKGDKASMLGGVEFVDEPMALPIVVPALVVMTLFEKKVVLDKDAGCGWFGWLGNCGIWVVARAVEDVALDPGKQRAAQEQYVASLKAAQAELCKLSDSQPSWEPIEALRRRLGDSYKADLLRRAGDLDRAIEVYQQLLAPKPDLPCSNKYPALSSGASLPFAVAPPEKREQLLESFRADVYLELAGLYREKGDLDRAVVESQNAERLLVAVVQLDPSDERNRIDLINTLADAGDLDAAVAQAREAIQALPGSPYFHYVLGRLLVKKKDADAAIVELQWALKEHKNHLSPANCELGRAYELKGDPRAALRQYRVAVRTHGGDKECHAAYERLKLQLKK